MANVACLGLLIADLFGSPMERLPAAGELALIDRYLLSAGGCASNAAAALGRLGRSSSVVGKVGEDLLGSFVVQDLRRLGAKTSFVKKTSAHPTSCTFILNVRGDDRRYIHCGGANLNFSMADVDSTAFDGARAVYVGGYLAMPAIRSDDLVELFRKAKQRGLLTALDVVIPAGHRPSLEEIRGALPYTDVFLPNHDEAFVLTGRSDALEQVRILSAFNQNCAVVITQGREGALAKQGDKILQSGIFEVDSIDESGCGDAFSAGFLVGMLENWPLEESLSFGSAVGASCSRAMGCHDGVFSFDEAMTFVTRNHLEIRTVA
jgi:sugar/nucleoside kinase (ribokinase family)